MGFGVWGVGFKIWGGGSGSGGPVRRGLATAIQPASTSCSNFWKRCMLNLAVICESVIFPCSFAADEAEGHSLLQLVWDLQDLQCTLHEGLRSMKLQARKASVSNMGAACRLRRKHLFTTSSPRSIKGCRLRSTLAQEGCEIIL